MAARRRGKEGRDLQRRGRGDGRGPERAVLGTRRAHLEAEPGGQPWEQVPGPLRAPPGTYLPPWTVTLEG